MPGNQRGWTDEYADQVIGNLLRAGVILSAAVVFLGGILYLFAHGGGQPDYATFHGGPADLRSLPAIVRGALTLDPRHVIQFGLVLLVATPVARVVFSVYAFARERDRVYVVVTLIVLAVLLLSLTGRV